MKVPAVGTSHFTPADANSLSDWRLPSIFGLIWLMVSPPAMAVDEFSGLGDYHSSFNRGATGVSADGLVVVGESSSVNGNEAFRWTATSGIVGLGDLSGGDFFSHASGVSADGSVVVGSSSSSEGTEAFRWTADRGMMGLGDLPGGSFYSRANDVSGDGLVVVGESSAELTGEAFRWSAVTGMVSLGRLPSNFTSHALAVNADGSVVVGYGICGQYCNEAFRWTTADGMMSLGRRDAIAKDVNADGSVIVGAFDRISQAFRWTEAEGFVGLGYLEPESEFATSSASAVNANGSVVVGAASVGTHGEAFRWTQTGGMRLVTDWLAEAGVEPTGWRLDSATGVNADGSVVVGAGINPDGDWESWLARNERGLIGLDTFAGSLGSVGGISSLGTQLAGLVLHGAHHRPLIAQELLEDSNCVWVSGDLGHYNRDRDADLAVGEFGACHDFIPGLLRAGLGIGASRATEDLEFNGDTEVDGGYLVAELDYRVPESTLIVSLTGLVGKWDATIDRGYLNSGVPDQSRGETDVDTATVRGRLEWMNAYRVGKFELSPHMEFTQFRTRVDSYTEKGGGFPAHYDSQTQTAQELRVGGSGELPLSDITYLRGVLEGVHRFDDDGPRLSGQVVGLFSFSFPGQDVRQDWARAGIELEHRLLPNGIVSASINASTRGEDPDMSAGLGARVLF